MENYKDRIEKLSITKRERQLVNLTVMGYDTDMCAHLMGLTKSTVLTYYKRVFAKTKVNSRVELLALVHGTLVRTRFTAPCSVVR